MKIEDAMETYARALRGTGTAQGHFRDRQLARLYALLEADETAAAERAFLGLMGAHAQDRELALMLPSLLLTTLPRILAAGSRYFAHEDGMPYRYGTGELAPAEYSLLYVERILRENLPGKDSGPAAPLPEKSPVYAMLDHMRTILYDMLPPPAKARADTRAQGRGAPPSNVVAFPFL